MPRKELTQDMLPTEVEVEGQKFELLFVDDDSKVSEFVATSKQEIKDFLMEHVSDDAELYFYLVELVPLESFVAGKTFKYVTVVCSTEELSFKKTVSVERLGKFVVRVKSVELNPTEELSGLEPEELEKLSKNPESIVNIFTSLVVEGLELSVKKLMSRY